MPLSLNNSFQNWLVNTGSLSLTIVRGKPYNLKMLSRKTLVTVVTVYG